MTDLFTSPPTAPAPASGRADEPAGAPPPAAAGEWVLAPQRYYEDGRKRPRFVMPAKVNPPPQRRNMDRKAVEHARAKRIDRKTAHRYRTSRERLDAMEKENET